ncbi:hypothetical protein MATL_G00123890 [Megalops atlanticus]|uniref:Interleukin-18 n=1 Tax=Megalops atlanticus TaxID=7932 RepID=A0A9D3Q3K0_MEGAT|nr:hypothetical protein MATL_G00123890 [Megalops atlanticus]
MKVVYRVFKGPDEEASMSADCRCVKVAHVTEDEIFFQVEDEDLDTDGFKRSHKCLIKMIQNKDQQFLVVDKELLKFERRNQEQCRSDDCHFKIFPYMNSNPFGRLGQPVILTVSDGRDSRVLCCREEGSGRGIYAKIQDPPDNIEESSHEAIFFLQAMKERCGGYRVESSLWRQWFLTFKAENQYLVKLVLRKVEDDMVDEGLHLLDL